ncbi:MAG: tetratricopeptide repeat protein [Acidobacteria bacterium]|nr:tetratricopeptide repeat protein [Acidobacteriota bacterium]
MKVIRKRYPEALELYQQALELEPRNPVLLNKTGIAYHQLHRLDLARKFYERATKADETYPYAWNNLGTVFYARRNYNKAIRFYRRALKLNPAEAGFHSNLGTAHFARKKFPEALEEFRLALLLDPAVFQQRGLLGVLLQDITVEDRARFNFLLAKSFAQLGYVEQCLLYLRRALEMGFPRLEAQGDPAFALIRNDQRFQELFPPAPPPGSRSQ